MITIEQESLTDEAERTGHCEQEQKEPGSSEGELPFPILNFHNWDLSLMCDVVCVKVFSD